MAIEIAPVNQTCGVNMRKAGPMRNLVMMIWLVATAAGSALGQPAPKKKSGLGKVAGQIVDSAVTAVAAGAVDSLLGTEGGPTVSCPAGTVPSGSGSAPSVGSAVVGKAKQKLTGAKKDAAAPTAQPACIPAPGAAPGVPTDAAAAQAAAMAAAMAGQTQGQPAGAPAMPAAGSIVKGMAAATPIGMAATAAPTAIKAVSGLLGGKGPSKEGMIKDLAKGRLILKGIKFIASSDALEDPIDDDIGFLAEALAAMEGTFVLNMPAEAEDKEEPDTTIARRRLTKLVANLQVAGISDERLVVGIYPPGLDPKNKAPKPGDARVEVLPMPKDFPRPER